jgi:hypothetical protein
MHAKNLPARATVALVAALTGGCSVVQVRTTIDIDAPAQRVWDILVDFERYAQWNPYHVSVQGEARQGARLSVQVLRPDGKRVHLEPHVLRLAEGRELTWGGGIRGVFHGEHVMRIEPTGPGTVRLVHDEDFSGFAVRFADLPPQVLTEGYQRMNRALKRRAEAGPVAAAKP